MKRVYRILLKHSVAIFCVLFFVCDLSYIRVVLCPSSRQILATPLLVFTHSSSRNGVQFNSRSVNKPFAATCRVSCLS